MSAEARVTSTRQVLGTDPQRITSAQVPFTLTSQQQNPTGDGMASRRRSISTGIRPEENQEFWRLQSPWVTSGAVPEVDNPPYRRPLVAGLVRRLIEDVPHRFHLLVGARRIGKTTVMTQVIADLLASGVDRGSLWFLRMDHPVLVGGDRHTVLMTSLKAFADARAGGAWLFLDELTVLPRWDL